MKNIFESPDRNLLGITLVEGFGERFRFYRENVLPDMIRRENEAKFMFTEGLYQAKIVNTPGSATCQLRESLFGVEKLFKGFYFKTQVLLGRLYYSISVGCFH